MTVTLPLPKAPPASSPAVRRVMQGNRKFDTRPETEVRRALHRLGLRFRKHRRPLPDLNCAADIVFPRERVAVFVDGCFWHGCPLHSRPVASNKPYWTAKIRRNVERDRRHDNALGAAGWLVIRAWEHQLPADVASQVEALVRQRRLELAS